LKSVNTLLQFSNSALELLIVGLQLIGVALLWCTETTLDEIDCVLRLLGLFVEADEDLGKLVDDSSLL